MSLAAPTFRSHLTLSLATILHAFTHAYAVMLVPLYLMARDDLHLRYVSSISGIVTIYGLVYALGSYAGGVMADRFDRKWLLGIGLLGNAAAITAMGLTRQYEMLIVLGIFAGLFGTLFHPAANALAPAHYPRSPGMAIGLLGIGSGLGFFIGPQYAGWRAQTARWQWGAIAQWQKPFIELGIGGIVFGVLFLVLANDPRKRTKSPGRLRLRGSRRSALLIREVASGGDPDDFHPPLGPILRWRVVWVALTLMLRDFAGIASQTLLSLYLQRAWNYDVKRAGFTVGAMMLLGMVANPLFVWLSPGKRRLPFYGLIAIVGAMFVTGVPWMTVAWVLPLMCAFQCCQLGSYAVSDAAMLERVPGALRGRVVGLFLTVAGTFSAMSPFVMGRWIDLLKGRATDPHAYVPLFATVGVMLGLSSFAVPFISRLGNVQGPRIEPMREIMPRTVEVMG
jgi:FSR family fosmidomycin resistance protein-like MFS transporter